MLRPPFVSAPGRSCPSVVSARGICQQFGRNRHVACKLRRVAKHECVLCRTDSNVVSLCEAFVSSKFRHPSYFKAGARTHTHIHMHMHIHMHTHNHTHIYIYICIHTCTHIYIYIHMRTHIHIYIYIHVCVLGSVRPLYFLSWVWRTTRR